MARTLSEGRVVVPFISASEYDILPPTFKSMPVPRQIILGAVIRPTLHNSCPVQVSFYQSSMRDDYSSIRVSSFRRFYLRSLQAAHSWLRIFFPGNACRLVVVPGQQPTFLPDSSVGQMVGRFWFYSSRMVPATNA